MGRLFTTPEERAMLESARHLPSAEVEREEKQESVIPEVDIPQSITINGVVSRSDGNSTLWVNGLNSFEGDLDAQRFEIDPHRIRAGEVVIQLPNNLGSVRLKPGETYEPAISTVIDSYQQAINTPSPE